MKNVVRKIAIVLGTVAVSVGLVGATTVAADAAPNGSSSSLQKLDTSWGR